MPLAPQRSIEGQTACWKKKRMCFHLPPLSLRTKFTNTFATYSSRKPNIRFAFYKSLLPGRSINRTRKIGDALNYVSGWADVQLALALMNRCILCKVTTSSINKSSHICARNSISSFLQNQVEALASSENIHNELKTHARKFPHPHVE